MVIADDEFIIRKGLLTIPWSEYGIDIVGEASNGMEALSIIKQAHPQILLTDIRMPGVDGLDLIRSAKMEVPDIKCILLTGYQDFNYAKTAIALGAIGYVLKPSDPDEIIEVIMRAKQLIVNELNEKLESERLKQQASSARSLIVNSFFQDLLFGRITDSSLISEKCIEYNHPLESYAIMLIEYDSGNSQMTNETAFMIEEEIRNIAMARNQCLVMHIDNFTCCIINELTENKIPPKDKMISMAMEIRDHIINKFDTYVCIGISRESDCAIDMNSRYNQALNCLKMKFSLGKGAIIHVEDLKDSLERQNLQTIKLTDEILESVKLGNYRKVEKLTRELLYRLAREQYVEEQIIKTICYNLLADSLRIIKEKKADDTVFIDEQMFYTMLKNCTYLSELEESVLNLLLKVMDSVCSKVPAVRNKVIQDILDYIDCNYMQDISLVTASEYVHMNHIYISRLIKKETGETFLDILTKTRMKKACELLTNTDLKTYEISYKVGINDCNYFSQVFKKNLGVTPSEYRESFINRQKIHKGEDL